MEILTICILVFSVFFNILYYLRISDRDSQVSSLKDELDFEKKYCKELKDDHEMGKLALEISNKKLNEKKHELIKEKVEHKVLEKKHNSILYYFQDSIFYDKQNDTIVTMDNLERIGEL